MGCKEPVSFPPPGAQVNEKECLAGLGVLLWNEKGTTLNEHCGIISQSIFQPNVSLESYFLGLNAHVCFRQSDKKWPNSSGPAGCACMVTQNGWQRIRKSMGKKRTIDSRKNKLCTCFTDQEKLHFAFKSREHHTGRVCPVSSMFEELFLQCRSFAVGCTLTWKFATVFTVVIALVVAEIQHFDAKERHSRFGVRHWRSPKD